ncbi:hypothetical protein MGWOODY_Smn2499 [hydrothermal vent metagenome]|uniref:Uncharacterized protein n=1 Tax=hydrothermal vent metagenome TaxID=652676 RepID=A0A160TPY5_9ZZZZ
MDIGEVRHVLVGAGHDADQADRRLRIDIDLAGLRIVATARPVGAALQARCDQRAERATLLAERRRGEEGSGDIVLHQLERLGMQLGREVDQILGAGPLAVIGRRPGREGLGRRIPFAGHVARLYLALDDRPDRLAGLAVEHIEPGLLARLGQRLDHLSRHRDVAQDRRAGQVAIPQAVMDELVMPAPLPGVHIDRDERFAEQRIAAAIHAHLVARGQLDRQIDQAKLLIGRHLRPDAGIAGLVGIAVQPAVVTILTLFRDRVENPFALAGAHIERADIAFHVEAGRRHVARGVGRADHDHVLHHQGRRVQADISGDRVDLLVEILLQVDDAVHAERGVGIAGRCVETDELIADRHEQDPLLRAVGPVGAAMTGELARRILRALALVDPVHPQHLASGSVERDAVAARAGCQEQASLHEQGCRLELIFLAGAERVGLETPGDFQIVEVGRVDLVERGVARIRLVGGIMAPLGIDPGIVRRNDRRCPAAPALRKRAGLRQQQRRPGAQQKRTSGQIRHSITPYVGHSCAALNAGYHSGIVHPIGYLVLPLFYRKPTAGERKMAGRRRSDAPPGFPCSGATGGVG